LVFALASGYLTGAIYPITNSLYLEKENAGDTGYIYGLELVGGCLLTIIFALFVMPFLGLIYFAGLIAFMILACYLVYRKGELNT